MSLRDRAAEASASQRSQASGEAGDSASTAEQAASPHALQRMGLGALRQQFALALKANFGEAEAALADDHEDESAPETPSGDPKAKRFRGVTRHKRTRRFEAHIWQSKKQIYLGGFDSEQLAAKSHDIMALRCKGTGCDILNFPLPHYSAMLPLIERLSQEDIITALRNYSKAQTVRKAAPAALHATKGAPRKPRAPKRQQPGSPRAGLTINTSRQRSFSEEAMGGHSPSAIYTAFGVAAGQGCDQLGQGGVDVAVRLAGGRHSLPSSPAALKVQAARGGRDSPPGPFTPRFRRAGAPRALSIRCSSTPTSPTSCHAAPGSPLGQARSIAGWNPHALGVPQTLGMGQYSPERFSPELASEASESEDDGGQGMAAEAEADLDVCLDSMLPLLGTPQQARCAGAQPPPMMAGRLSAADAASLDSLDLDALLGRMVDEPSLTYSASEEHYLFEPMAVDPGHTGVEHLSGVALVQDSDTPRELPAAGSAGLPLSSAESLTALGAGRSPYLPFAAHPSPYNASHDLAGFFPAA